MKNQVLKSFLFIALISPLYIHSQSWEKCGFNLATSKMELKHPGYQTQIDNVLKRNLENKSDNKLRLSQTILRIPVVVHVVYENATENLDDSLIYNQIEVLNEDFRRLNSDAVNTRSEFLDVAADTYIEFELASTDPDGNPTNGITRTETTETSFMDFSLTFDLMKKTATGGIDAWPTNKYLNIWVCDLAVNFAGQSIPALYGYAYPPSGLSNWPGPSQTPTDTTLEGVVIHYQGFGRNNPYGFQIVGADTMRTDRGRTATHEVGHYLGLRHVWGDGPCNEDDFMDDTPKMAGQSNFDCDTTINSCVDTLIDLPDMIENFMDYSAESCQNAFTQDQANLMYNVLLNERSGLPTPIYPASTNQTKLKTWKIYPNPAHKHIFIEGEAKSIELFELNGKLIRNITNYSNPIDISLLANGIYIMKLTDKNENQIFTKLISIH